MPPLLKHIDEELEALDHRAIKERYNYSDDRYDEMRRRTPWVLVCDQENLLAEIEEEKDQEGYATEVSSENSTEDDSSASTQGNSEQNEQLRTVIQAPSIPVVSYPSDPVLEVLPTVALSYAPLSVTHNVAPDVPRGQSLSRREAFSICNIDPEVLHSPSLSHTQAFCVYDTPPTTFHNPALNCSMISHVDTVPNVPRGQALTYIEVVCIYDAPPTTLHNQALAFSPTSFIDIEPMMPLYQDAMEQEIIKQKHLLKRAEERAHEHERQAKAAKERAEDAIQKERQTSERLVALELETKENARACDLRVQEADKRASKANQRKDEADAHAQDCTSRAQMAEQRAQSEMEAQRARADKAESDMAAERILAEAAAKSHQTDMHQAKSAADTLREQDMGREHVLIAMSERISELDEFLRLAKLENEQLEKRCKWAETDAPTDVSHDQQGEAVKSLAHLTRYHADPSTVELKLEHDFYPNITHNMDALSCMMHEVRMRRNPLQAARELRACVILAINYLNIWNCGACGNAEQRAKKAELQAEAAKWNFEL
ncbi:hypothetical protein P153DRAFT_401825 [Dothidotthia symphoricarpi CBS 119687]|uniref:Uncharacterized protein n=1 Tax=Dothidotthia symphoricarpi CBS 119687 TaxID=1392245 RepID=A0A6A5ZVM2_9PLEO|nr:uncharacterized protein P153DRAFT_401825 [Dothidotthia symphoricarpi CBS 119687]KAF2123579.1 hypothetical protein P153DRAFT_401825 [Dothidotthia symphoricarpi CBS 119687]